MSNTMPTGMQLTPATVIEPSLENAGSHSQHETDLHPVDISVLYVVILFDKKHDVD